MLEVERTTGPSMEEPSVMWSQAVMDFNLAMETGAERPGIVSKISMEDCLALMLHELFGMWYRRMRWRCKSNVDSVRW